MGGKYLSNFDLELKFISFVSLPWSLQTANTHVNMRFARFSLYFGDRKTVLKDRDLVVVSVVMYQFLLLFRFSNHRTRIKRVC